MSTLDPMAAAIDWLDAYRAATLSIVHWYAPDASLRCGCNGETTVIGRYWRQRFIKSQPVHLKVYLTSWRSDDEGAA
jgi:hypothetical protein